MKSVSTLKGCNILTWVEIVDGLFPHLNGLTLRKPFKASMKKVAFHILSLIRSVKFLFLAFKIWLTLKSSNIFA